MERAKTAAGRASCWTLTTVHVSNRLEVHIFVLCKKKKLCLVIFSLILGSAVPYTTYVFSFARIGS